MADKVAIRGMRPWAILLVSGLLASCEKPGDEQTPVPTVSYAEDVVPILQKHCIACHVAGQQGAEASGLLLDTHASLMQGSRFGPVINPGSAMTSSLFVLISGEERLTITMPHGKEPLAPAEVETIRAWIESGAADN
jgi:hypothetical protein